MAIKTKTRTAIMKNFPKEAIVALGKAIRKEEVATCSSDLLPGEYNIDLLVRVTGTIKKGGDFEQKIVAKAQPWDIIAVLMSKLNGVTIESVVKESLKIDPDKVTEIKVESEKAMSKIKKATITRMNGRISPSLNLEIIK